MCTNGVRFLSTLILFAASLFAQWEDAWRRDIDLFARELPARHGDLFQNVSREQFYDELRELLDTVTQKTDALLTAGLLRVAAMARDSHTTVFHALNSLPIEVTWFQEGLYITAALPEFGGVIGARVLKFHETTSEAALTKVAPIISHENQHRLKARSETVLVTAPLLFAQGIVPEPSKAVLELATPNGASRTVELPSIGVSYRSVFLPAARRTERLHTARATRSRHAVLVRVSGRQEHVLSRVQSLARRLSESVHIFASRMIADLADKAVDRVIIDLRHNGGGVGRFDPWFASALSDGAKPGSLRLSRIGREDGESDAAGSFLLLRVTAADASISFGHTEAEVVERTSTEDNWQNRSPSASGAER